MIRLVHISDSHLEKENLDLEKNALVDGLFNDLTKYVDEKTIIAFTGDLIDKGGIAFNETLNPFNEFKKIIVDRLIDKFPSLNEKVFIVPGNHDVQRNKIDKLDHFALTGMLKDNPEEASAFIKKNINGSIKLNRIEQYKNFEKSFFSNYTNSKLTYFHSSFNTEINGKSIGISCLNSSWLCKDEKNDCGNLILGKAQIDDSLLHIKDAEIKIALIHHPIEFLCEPDMEVVTPLIYENYDIVLIGHTHKKQGAYHQDLQGNLFISKAQSTNGEDTGLFKYANGYTVIDMIPNKCFKVHYRKYLLDKKVFVTNTDIGNDEGVKVFQIPTETENELQKNINSSIDYIKGSHVENVNNDLIVFNCGEEESKTISNLFVEPTLCNMLENQVADEDEAGILYYSIEDLLNKHENFLIYGPKESGKTILLDKILIDCVNYQAKYKKIPILIKFPEISNKKIKQIMRTFLALKKEVFEEMLPNAKFVLLIDDFSFSDQYYHQLNKLKLFLQENDNVQVIASILQPVENVVPTDHLEQSIVFPQYSMAFIHSLSGRQIKGLINKWFGNRQDDCKENMENLLRNFYEFSLPRNPLTVTLFLWIFERQERRPINNAVLIEMFVENLLEKANFDNIYQNEFDFHNKQRFLASLSKYMLDHGNADYSYVISYSETLEYTKQYLKTKFDGNPKLILDNLIKRGILIENGDNSIRFKSSFLFHYFLSRYMVIKPEFKKYIFTNENYLNFSNEIEYYTGLQRDSEDVLDFVINKLSEAFDEYNNQLDEDNDKVDAFLETEETLSELIDIEKFKNKPSEEDLDRLYDDRISQLPAAENDIPKKDDKLINKKKPLDIILKLSAIVLKNSEEIDDFQKRKSAYRKILISSVSFMILYRSLLMKYVDKHRELPAIFPKNIEYDVFVKLLPLIHQVVVYNWLGSAKLVPVVREKINEDQKNNSITEFEKFMSIFIYSDIRARNYTDFIKQFLKEAKSTYILDTSFIKLLSYYHLRSNDPESDKMYLRLLGDLKERLNEVSKKSKSQYMQKLKMEKLKSSHK